MTGLQVDGAGLSIVIAAYNEETGIGPTLRDLIHAFPAAEIIVVDDGSRDGTWNAANFHGVKVIRHLFNRGQGAALKTGMRHATRPWVGWYDADHEHRPEDLRRLIEQAMEYDLVAVIGQRNASLSRTRAIGKAMIRLVGRGLHVNAGSDLNCGMRLFNRSVILRYLPLIPNRFSASLVTTLILIERRYPFSFVPVKVNVRIGNSTVRMRDGFEAFLVLIRAILLFAPLRFFLPLGLLLIGLGAAYSAAVAFVVGEGLPGAGILTIVTGLLALALGMISDQISQMWLSQLPDESPLSDGPPGGGRQ